MGLRNMVSLYISQIAPMDPNMVIDEELNKAENFLDDWGCIRGIECYEFLPHLFQQQNLLPIDKLGEVQHR